MDGAASETKSIRQKPQANKILKPSPACALESALAGGGQWNSDVCVPVRFRLLPFRRSGLYGGWCRGIAALGSHLDIRHLALKLLGFPNDYALVRDNCDGDGGIIMH